MATAFALNAVVRAAGKEITTSMILVRRDGEIMADDPHVMHCAYCGLRIGFNPDPSTAEVPLFCDDDCYAHYKEKYPDKVKQGWP